jgi:hypothetical protein
MSVPAATTKAAAVNNSVSSACAVRLDCDADIAIDFIEGS